MKLTPLMRDVLDQARRQELLRRPQEAWPAPWQTLRALQRHGLLAQSERLNRRCQLLTIWTITDTGRQALQPIEVTRIDRPLYLAQIVGARGDYTPDPKKASDLLEIVDTGDLNTTWQTSARTRHDHARDDQDRPPGIKPPNRRERTPAWFAEQQRRMKITLIERLAA